MEEIFKELFKNYDIPKDRLAEFLAGFSAIAILKLVGVTEDRFSNEEKIMVKEALTGKDSKTLERIILSKYSSDELDQVIKAHILPLFECYQSQVFA